MLLEINVNSILETPSFNNLYKLLLLDKRRWIQTQKRLKTEEFETYARVFIRTPSPCSKPHFTFGTPLIISKLCCARCKCK